MTLTRLVQRLVFVTTIAFISQPGFTQDIDLNKESLVTLKTGISMSGASHNSLSVVATDEGELFLVSEQDGKVTSRLVFSRGDQKSSKTLTPVKGTGVTG